MWNPRHRIGDTIRGLNGGKGTIITAINSMPIDTATRVVTEFAAAGFTHATGVPCSLLAGLFRDLEKPDSPLRYVPTPREDTAVGVASGLSLAQQRPLVLMQNSGLGYCLNVLTSFTLIYDVHLPIVVSWRGHDATDAVEHDVIGRDLTRLLDVFGFLWMVFDPAEPERSVQHFIALFAGGTRTVVLIVKKAM